MGGKGARFTISAFSRYKDYKISDLTQSNRYSSVPNPNQYRAVLFSLGPRSAMGEKGEKRGQIGKKSASRAVSWGGLSHSQTTSWLASLANFFFWPRGSQWDGGFYGYRLKFWLFYGYRLIFFSYR